MSRDCYDHEATMSSIKFQLERIADALEKVNERAEANQSRATILNQMTHGHGAPSAPGVVTITPNGQKVGER